MPKSAGLTDDQFDDLLCAACDSFEAGFNEAYPEELVPPAQNQYRCGAEAAVAMMQSWKYRGEDRIDGAQMMAELVAGLYGREGDERRGYADSLMGYVMLTLSGYEAPAVSSWKVEDNFQQWIGEANHA
jgi:hypothetical protein